ncbi:hypothetical protein [Mycobacterium sp. E740]|uniref:hypothetical protein n=1 Tax=Mycobacterium sp. E740 TaxID=1834149 RepID=UPI00080114FC|nr:hypothetical protein [Mycobacterium sp. E740]OBI73501.1 hypothetical protein A5663_06820 [Mycobacterium sp. E740]
MTDLITAPTERQEIIESGPVVTEVAQPPVLITVQQVAFSTAAAASLPRTKPHHGLVAAVRAMLSSHEQAASPADDRVPPSHYLPHREAFLESAAMAREMLRL